MTEEQRYEWTLHRMHIATERNQPWWGLCPIPPKPRWGRGDGSGRTYEERRESLREERRHWYLMYSLSRPANEDTRSIWEW
jgi:hypothetical protein